MIGQKKNTKAFTLLELIVVITLLSVVFALIGFTFIKNIEGSLDVSKNIHKTISSLSIYNQLEKQIFAKYTPKNQKTVIKLTEDSLSFYTGYPIFYEGFVRAEYKIKNTEDNMKLLIYEEYPYVDGKLGEDGIKKVVLGKFRDLTIEFIKNKKVYQSFNGNKFPKIIKIKINDYEYYIEAF